ncbi:MAG TPA: bifunctional homocysteine S-methyltransferase/methylenetetrahydrofolate reductase [Ktedonobacterales bacterium]|nr:bifunctional homocysteine S-methyltransferase/methylenetetrahydrofolate reductase [Ktedonobacterales bacterium]
MSELVLERLRQGPLLCDGGMGTMLYARAPEDLMHGRCFDELVLTAPELVQEIHREYILAGAQIIETNTFGANAAKLSAYGLADRVQAINRRAAQLAREAREVAGQTIFVAGAVGPSGQLQVREVGDDEPRLAALRALYREQIEALMEGGVELLMLETFSSLTELQQAVLAAREAGDLPIIAQMTFSEDGQTLAGESPTMVARALAQMGVQIIGSNCSVGPAGILDAVSEMRNTVDELAGKDSADILLTAQPNAGLPQRLENRFLYGAPPQYFGDYTHRFVEAGVRLIGGCCGTTPAHIAAMRDALSGHLPTATQSTFAVSLATPSSRSVDTSRALPEEAGLHGVPQTRLRQELDAGCFVVSIELDPPKGLNPQKILDGAAYLKGLGVNFINIADSPMARVRMSCLALARLLRDQLDLETIVHATTRDRNLMALQSDLLGAHALGVYNVLALTGDPLHAGNYPNLTGVWDVDSVGLIRVLRGMNEGHDAAGAPLGLPAHFHIGAALNLNMEDDLIDLDRERTRHKLPGAEQEDVHDHDLDDILPHEHSQLTETELEIHRLRQKLAAGAQYIMTQPIYSIEPLERFSRRFGSMQVPVILGMIPLHSSKHAEYLHNEVPGISIPEEVRARMREAGDRGREVGIQLAHEVITEAQVRGLIQGCYLMPSFGRYDLVGELARELLRLPSPMQAALD